MSVLNKICKRFNLLITTRKVFVLDNWISKETTSKKLLNKAKEDKNRDPKIVFTLLDRSIYVNSNRTETFIFRSTFNRDQRKYIDAFADLFIAMKLATPVERHLVHFELGYLYNLIKMHQEAYEQYNFALQTAPRNHDLSLTYNNRGYSLEKLQQYEEAIADPNYTIARFNLGVCYNTIGKYKEAIENFDLLLCLPITLSSERTRMKTYYNRGLAHKALNNLKKALNDFLSVELFSPEEHERAIREKNSVLLMIAETNE